MFRTPLVLETAIGGYILGRSYIYVRDDVDVIIAVPAGFFTDLASIPRLFWKYVANEDKGVKEAAVIHDWLYNRDSIPDFPGLSKKEADTLFLEIMLEMGTPKWKAYSAYLGVTLFGRRFFRPRK